MHVKINQFSNGQGYLKLNYDHSSPNETKNTLAIDLAKRQYKIHTVSIPEYMPKKPKSEN